MKIKTPIEFLTFNDGVLRLFETDDDDNIIAESEKKFAFGEQTVGVKRYYAARENDIELNKVIHTHLNRAAVTDIAAVIGNTRYKIEQIQHKFDTNPPSTVFSLSQRGLYEGAENDI